MIKRVALVGLERLLSSSFGDGAFASAPTKQQYRDVASSTNLFRLALGLKATHIASQGQAGAFWERPPDPCNQLSTVPWKENTPRIVSCLCMLLAERKRVVVPLPTQSRFAVKIVQVKCVSFMHRLALLIRKNPNLTFSPLIAPSFDSCRPQCRQAEAVFLGL